MIGTFKRIESESIFERWYFDLYILVPTITLVSLGFVMVASASFSYAEQRFGSELFFVRRHSLYLMIGLSAMCASFWVPSSWWCRHSKVFISSAILLLMLVLVPDIGREFNGSKRWLVLGGITIQVSELVKLAIICFLSASLARDAELQPPNWRQWLSLLMIITIINILLILEPDYGSVVVVSGISLALLFLGGISLRFFFFIAVTASVGLFAAVWFSNYRWNRITAFTNPWADPDDDGYQLIQSLIALGRGEWFGVGLGQSVQKMQFLPDGYTDFIFAIYAEEFGFFGIIILLSIFSVLVSRIFILSHRALKEKNWYITYVTMGLGLLISGQTFINIGVNSGLLPTKGLTLPFVSYGGTSLVCCLTAIGILMRFSHELKQVNRIDRRRKNVR
jgi:cell division protein FtsW